MILDYLCEYFNGSAMQMFKVLSQGEREHIETYDLPERLLAQMMFTGERIGSTGYSPGICQESIPVTV